MISGSQSGRLRAVPPPKEPEALGEPNASVVDETAIDNALIQRALAGDGSAWSRLYQRHFQRLHADLLFMVQDSATAEELAQEAFAAALISLRRFDHRAKFSTWMRGIGQNLVRKHWRGRARRGRAYDRLEASTPMVGVRAEEDPEVTHLQKQRAKVLSAVLETLPVSLREVFVMRDVQGLSVEDVAERLNISPGNVRVRANRARGRIRAELSKLGWIQEEEEQ